MISERRLRDWRSMALKNTSDYKIYSTTCSGLIETCKEYRKQIPLMTQELLDLHLLNKENKKL